jgi:hypothetical protein
LIPSTTKKKKKKTDKYPKYPNLKTNNPGERGWCASPGSAGSSFRTFYPAAQSGIHKQGLPASHGAGEQQKRVVRNCSPGCASSPHPGNSTKCYWVEDFLTNQDWSQESMASPLGYPNEYFPPSPLLHTPSNASKHLPSETLPPEGTTRRTRYHHPV